MLAPRTAALVTALFLVAAAPVARATDPDPRMPVVRCFKADAYKTIPYAGVAYVKGSETPTLLTIMCSVDNGRDRSVTWQQVRNSPVVALAWYGSQLWGDSMKVCTSATAEYEDGTVLTTSHCGSEKIPPDEI